MEMPARLNRWLGFAPNWGGAQGPAAEAVRFMIRVEVPTLGAGGGYAGYETGTRALNGRERGCR